jgi:hypothetical protein
LEKLIELSFSDSVIATDDFHGAADPDDDQWAELVKQAEDSSSTIDDFSLLTEKSELDDETTITELVELTHTKSRIDLINSLDSGSIHIQNYFASNYVEPGYVGSTTSF